MKRFRFYNNCVNWPHNDVDCDGGLCDLIDDAIDITRETFLKHVDVESLRDQERSLGYNEHYKQGLVMSQDWAVSYFKSKLHNKLVYGFNNSAIEYVFV